MANCFINPTHEIPDGWIRPEPVGDGCMRTIGVNEEPVARPELKDSTIFIGLFFALLVVVILLHGQATRNR